MPACFQDKLSQKYARLDKNISLVHGDISHFNLNRKFNTILLPWRAFHYLTEPGAPESCLDCVGNHMEDEAIFIFDIFHPLPSYGEDWLGQESLTYDVLDPQTGNRIIRSTRNECSDVENQIIKYSSNYRIIDKENNVTRLQDTLTYRYYSYRQITELLDKHGFTVIEQYGYYDKSPIENGKEFIFVCKLKK